MSRTVEMGRAVIALQAASIDLWLTTLITLSPDANNSPAQHTNLDFCSLAPNELLGYLSSGNTWVARGPAMHMTFDIQKLGRPLHSDCLRQLGDGIVNAPAWKQLGLCLTFPLNYHTTNGNLRIDIDYCRENDLPHTDADNCIASSIEMGIRPPQGVPIFLLESIGFVVAIHDTKPRTTVRKRPKREVTQQAPDTGEPESLVGNKRVAIDETYKSKLVLNSSTLSLSNVHQDDEHQLQGTGTPQLSQKLPNEEISSKLRSSSPNRGKRKRPVMIPEIPATQVTEHLLSESVQIVGLTDAFLRFSISLNLRGASCNPKVKAHTFNYGLANVAPALWRAGYLSACSHVMHVNPTLGRSLSRIGRSAKSASLKAKIGGLTEHSSVDQLEQSFASQTLLRDAASTITDRLWVHMQKSQLSKPAHGPIQALCDPRFIAASIEEAAELLEEQIDLGLYSCQDVDETPETREKPSLSMSDPSLIPVPNGLLENKHSTMPNDEVPRSLDVDVADLDVPKSPKQYDDYSISGPLTTMSNSSSQTSTSTVVEDEELLFDCNMWAKHDALERNILFSERTSEDHGWTSEAVQQFIDDEDILFDF